MTSQPTPPGIFVTFSKLCVWGRTNGHGSRGSCPSAKAPAQPERPGRGQASHLCPPCHALSVPGPADPPQQQSPQGDQVNTPGVHHCDMWPICHPPQELGLGSVPCWEQSWVLGDTSRAQMRSVAFLILNEAKPMQGRDGGGLPTFPTSSGDYGGQRKKRLAPTTCWSERGEGSIFM